MIVAFKCRDILLCRSYCFDNIPSKAKCDKFAQKHELCFRGCSFKTIRAIKKLSTPFESYKQDLSFGGCNFFVCYLVLEILAKTRRKCDCRLAMIPLFAQAFNHILTTFDLISKELVKIQKSYTHQMKHLASSFQMACFKSLYLL